MLRVDFMILRLHFGHPTEMVPLLKSMLTTRSPSFQCRPLGYIRPLLSRQALGPSRSAFEAAQASQGDGGGVLAGGLLGGPRHGVNYGLGDLVEVPACALRHRSNISPEGRDINRGENSK